MTERSRSESGGPCVDGDDTVRYFYGTRVLSDWSPGGRVAWTYPDGSLAADGTVISVDPRAAWR